MRPYCRKVQYYETDMMGLVHHSNYIRWMEEARVDFLDQLGFPYAEMEKRGVLSPVKSLACDYLKPCAFGDEAEIIVTPAAFNGVVLTIHYDMRNKRTGEQVCSARSEHVFLNREGHFVRMKRDMPDFCAAITALIPEEKNEER